MALWDQGYVTDVEYTHGYYVELNPVRAGYALAHAGIAPARFETACELGFGQGVSIAIHDTAGPAQWWGTDFNPQHAAFAQGLARGGLDAARRFSEQGFEEFCRRVDLPDFDFIGLHGIWTWISEENQKIVVDFIRRKLKVGGVLYISYNTYPGWADLAPLRHLIKTHVDVVGDRGLDLFGRIDRAMEFTEALAATSPFYMASAPRAQERLKMLRTHSANYIAHEYLTHDWNTMYFAEFAERISGAKVSYATSANLLDSVDVLNLRADQQTLMKGISDPIFRETVRDYCVNQQFRRDLWVKGGRRLSEQERLEVLRGHNLVLGVDRSSIELKARGALGEAQLHAHVYDPILDELADFQVHTVGELEAAVLRQGVSSTQLFAALPILVGQGMVHVAQSHDARSSRRDESHRLAQQIIATPISSTKLEWLPSPVTGGGVHVPKVHQLFLRALTNGATTAGACAASAWEELRSVGQKVVKDGAVVESDEDNLSVLATQAAEFIKVRVPALKALDVF